MTARKDAERSSVVGVRFQFCNRSTCSGWELERAIPTEVGSSGTGGGSSCRGGNAAEDEERRCEPSIFLRFPSRCSDELDVRRGTVMVLGAA